MGDGFSTLFRVNFVIYGNADTWLNFSRKADSFILVHTYLNFDHQASKIGISKKLAGGWRKSVDKKLWPGRF